MADLLYKLQVPIIRMLSPRKIFSKNCTELSQWFADAKGTSLRTVKIPAWIKKSFVCKEQKIAGCNCPIIEPRTGYKPGAPAVLFIHGGGFLIEAAPVHWIAAATIVRKTGAQLWFCSYPQLPEATFYESTDAVLVCYYAMKAHFASVGLSDTPIVFVGDSAGAYLAITATRSLIAAKQGANQGLQQGETQGEDQGVAQGEAQDVDQGVAQGVDQCESAGHDVNLTTEANIANTTDIPAVTDIPDRLILISPPTCIVNNPLVKEQMLAIAPRDLMIPISLLDTLQKMMAAQDTRDDFFLMPLEGSCKGFPPTAVYCGSEEIFYPLMPDFIKQLRAANALIGFYPGNGLCHIYPYVPSSLDCRRALLHICKLISETTCSVPKA
ncbi:MAG: alpha/beta hydrolase fold domain-containing protein [Coriobacteriales bacterium]|jgi:acetyl esterase/lipase|nr:alpha/beta hydrolase fold domain-containing protein [Coriobacteriales bacterium]